jgi:hypothetical protein
MSHLIGVTSYIQQVNSPEPATLNGLLDQIEQGVNNVTFVLMTSSENLDHIRRISEPFPKIKFCFRTMSPIKRSRVLSLPSLKDVTNSVIETYKGQAPILMAGKSLDDIDEELMDGITKVQIVSTLLGHSSLSTKTPGVDPDGSASKRLILRGNHEWSLSFQKAAFYEQVVVSVRNIANQGAVEKPMPV